jgi:glycosyltransferase involved in cell wall biosynthesis
VRVAIIVSRIDQLGPVKVIQNLVNELSRIEGLIIKVFYLDKNVDQKINMDVPVERLERRNFCFAEYDIIHTNGIRPDLFAFLNRKKIKYHISTIHNFVFDDLAFTYNRLISFLFGNIWLILWRRADKLVCVSKAMKTYYSKWYSLSKLIVIYNGIAQTDNTFQPDYEIIRSIESYRSKGLKVIVSVGNLTKRKGIDQILHLVAEEKELALMILGDGKELPKLVKLSKKLNITDRCNFCGFQVNAVNYLKHFDFYIMPSRSEGFGLALIEAVQQKIPVICSDIQVFEELLTNEEVTFFKPGDLTSLSEALKMADRTGIKKTDLAYTRYLNNYTDKLMAKHYFELYQSAF